MPSLLRRPRLVEEQAHGGGLGQELQAWLIHEIRAASLQDSQLLALALPAPVATPERLLALVSTSTPAVLWDPPDGSGWSGVGVARSLEPTGEGRFRALREQAAQQVAEMQVRCHADTMPWSPRWLGGFAFDAGTAEQAPWSELGDTSFTLPRFTYTVDKGRACLALTLDGSEARDAATVEALSQELGRLLQGLTEVGPGVVQPARSHRIERLDRERWRQLVEAIRGEIADGRFEKIVAARRSVLHLASPVARELVLARLSQGLLASTRFAFCRPGGAFLGATPERLIALRGRSLSTEALAGSIDRSTDRAHELLRNHKDLIEHRLVVEAIERRLAPLCTHLDLPAEPQIRELREVLHLRTPIQGELRQHQHVLELVELLHPTPAVGGVPTRAALQWIPEHEPEARGWYAGPIGWFDAEGNGEFAVALRSCMLTPTHAYLYAGAGIVGGSQADLEYEETELKQQVLLAALGGHGS